jgi:nucleotide-binding universal stress UspA family protein
MVVAFAITAPERAICARLGRPECDVYTTIVCGVHRAETARAAADAARQLARQLGATLHLVGAFNGSAEPSHVAHAGEAPGRHEMESFLDQLAARGGVPGVRTHALPGDPSAAILRVADEVAADLIVVGNKGMRGIHRVLGSVPNSIAHKASCAVLIVNTT